MSILAPSITERKPHPHLAGPYIFSPVDIAVATVEMGARITADYAHRNRKLFLVGIAKGGLRFWSDLQSAIDTAHIQMVATIMGISSYGAGTISNHAPSMTIVLAEDVSGHDVLVVEDIIDGGDTVNFVRDIFRASNPASLEVATLLHKFKAPISPRYWGLRCPDQFVVGYGLDYKGLYRELPGIGVLAPEHR
jgi:hypoxanthine phosphoribosyltransferase